jgi:hypothetical protein
MTSSRFLRTAAHYSLPALLSGFAGEALAAGVAVPVGLGEAAGTEVADAAGAAGVLGLFLFVSGSGLQAANVSETASKKIVFFIMVSSPSECW